MSETHLLIPGEYYHIYNHANEPESFFRQPRNYPYFMRLYARYMTQFAQLYAFCLMPNHFHFLLRIGDLEQLRAGEASLDAVQHAISLQFANWFSTYTKAFNHAYGRRGSLFMRPFRRNLISDEGYLLRLVVYIHHNPQKHGIVSDFRAWRFSSYGALAGSGKTAVERDAVLTWFGGREAFVTAHAVRQD